MRFFFLFFLTSLSIKSYCGQVDSSKIKQVEKLFDNYYNTSPEHFDSAIIYLDSAFVLSKKINYFKGITDAIREKGYVYSERGDYVKAMQFYIEALKFDEKVKNKDGEASDLNVIGLLYDDREKLDEALSYLLRARKKFTELKDELGIAMVSGNLGNVYRNKNNFKLALECYTYAMEYYKKEKTDYNEANVAIITNNIGNIYKDLRQYDKALEYFFESKEIKSRIQQYSSLVTTLSNIGDVLVEQKKYKEALRYYNEALEIAEREKSPKLLKDVHVDLSNLYKKLGDYKLAYENYIISTQLKDSLISEKNNNDIAELKVRYESEKKEKENQILLKDNELQVSKIADEKKQKLLFASLFFIILLAAVFVFIQYRTKQKLNKQLALINEKIKNQNKTLKILNKELIDSEENLTLANSSKDQLISMLSHDLYNPVTSVINYTNLTLESVEDQTKEELVKSLSSINNAVVPLQDLLDNILQCARTQKENLKVNFEEIDLNYIINDIIKLYQPLATFKNIKIEYDSSSEYSINTDRLMMYFILRNIVNNAVKFSSKKTSIYVNVLIENGMVQIAIKDQGNGFKPEILSQLNNKELLQLDGQLNGSGIGLSVSRKFISLLNGNIVFRNVQEGGAEVVLTFHQD